MALISPRWLVALAAVVIVWAGVHGLSGHPASITPAVWPSAATSPSPSPSIAGIPLGGASLAASPRPAATAVPVLPDILRRLNGETGRSAGGLYHILQQLEGAVGATIESLVSQLEPHR